MMHPQEQSTTLAFPERNLTLAGLVSGGKLAWLKDLGLITGFTLLIALGAQVKLFIPPISEVPFVLSDMMVVLAGAVLGSRRGLASVALYLAVGAIGLPVFANNGSGWQVLTGLSAGFLFAFPVSAFVVGRMSERGWDRRFGTALLAMFAANLIILLGGGIWYAIMRGPEAALTRAIMPFVLVDLLKMVVAAAVLPSAWLLIRKSR
jgi:biotin transport system substrate-specific component